MTQVFAFAPSVSAPFRFQPTLDGQTYSAVVTWNLFGQRWYLNVSDLSGNLVFSLPVVGSPADLNITSLTWADGTVTCETDAPHSFGAVGQTAQIVLVNNSPGAYNGSPVDAFITGPSTFIYALAADPGLATTLGTAGFEVDMAGGYFGSTIVFSDADQQFVVTP